LLFSGRKRSGFAKGLFYGHFNASLVFPYPEIRAEEQATVEKAVAELRKFAGRKKLDPMSIDRNAEIPPEVIFCLGTLGVLGTTGAQGIRRTRTFAVGELQNPGGRSAAVVPRRRFSSTPIKHRHPGTFAVREPREQKKNWLPALCAGEKLAAFALTEPEAGSDAGNVQTTAIPSADGKPNILNGEKRYITQRARSLMS